MNEEVNKIIRELEELSDKAEKECIQAGIGRLGYFAGYKDAIARAIDVIKEIA